MICLNKLAEGSENWCWIRSRKNGNKPGMMRCSSRIDVVSETAAIAAEAAKLALIELVKRIEAQQARAQQQQFLTRHYHDGWRRCMRNIKPNAIADQDQCLAKRRRPIVATIWITLTITIPFRRLC